MHIADTKVARRYGDFFIRQIHKFEEVSIQHLILLHSHWPKLYGVLAILSAKGLTWPLLTIGYITLNISLYPLKTG